MALEAFENKKSHFPPSCLCMWQVKEVRGRLNWEEVADLFARHKEGSGEHSYRGPDRSAGRGTGSVQ